MKTLRNFRRLSALLALIFALAMVSLPLSHASAGGQTAPLTGEFAAYALPDGSVPAICSAGAMSDGSVPGLGNAPCLACLLLAAPGIDRLDLAGFAPPHILPARTIVIERPQQLARDFLPGSLQSRAPPLIEIA